MLVALVSFTYFADREEARVASRASTRVPRFRDARGSPVHPRRVKSMLHRVHMYARMDIRKVRLVVEFFLVNEF